MNVVALGEWTLLLAVVVKLAVVSWLAWKYRKRARTWEQVARMWEENFRERDRIVHGLEKVVVGVRRNEEDARLAAIRYEAALLEIAAIHRRVPKRRWIATSRRIARATLDAEAGMTGVKVA